MLQKLRSSVSGIFGIGLIILLVVAFAVWGIADSFTTLSNNVIARVGNNTIESVEYRLRFSQQLQALSRELDQPISLEQARALGVDTQVLRTMVGMAALNNATSDMGLALGDDAVAQSIIADPAFSGPSGKFDETVFRNVLSRNGLTEKLFTQDQRDFATRTQLLNALSNNAIVPAALVDRLYDYVLEKRIVRYIIVTEDAIGDIGAPSEEELIEFYEQSQLRFAEPERRTATVLSIEPERFAKSIKISDEDIQAEYDFRAREYQVPEKREIDQLVLADPESIETAVNMINAGKSFVEIVDATGQNLDNTDLGLVTKNEIIAIELADAAFSLKEGEMSEIIEGPLGSVIMRTRSITPSETIPLEAVKDEIKTWLTQTRATEELVVFSERILDEISAGERFEDIAQRFDLALVTLEKIDRNGLQKGEQDSTIMRRYPGLVEDLYMNEIGQELPMYETEEGGVYWARLDAIDETRSRPLEEVREDAIAQWTKLEGKKMLEALAMHLAERGNVTGNFDEIEKSLSRKAFTSEPLSRQSRNETFSTEGLERIFGSEKNKFTWAPVGFGGSLIVMQVQDIISPKRDNSKAVALIYDGEKEKYRLDLTNQFVNALQDSLGVDIDTGALDRALQQN